MSDLDRDPRDMRDDARAWARLNYPAITVGRYADAADQIQRLRSQLAAALAKVEEAERVMMDHRGALVRLVIEGNGCGKHCSLEFHRWAIDSMLKIAGDSLKRFAKPLPDPPAMTAKEE